MFTDLEVSRFMSRRVLSALPDLEGERAAEELLALGVSSLVVVDDRGRLLGVLTRRDFLRAGLLTQRRDAATASVHRVSSLMTSPAITVLPEANLVVAATEMVARRIHRLIVARGDEPLGVLSTRDLMTAVMAVRLATPLGEVMSAPVASIEVSASLGEAVAALASARVGGLVATEEGLPVGYFTEVEAISSRALPPSTPLDEVMSQALLCLPIATPLHRAAGFSLSTRARRIVVTDHRHVKGLVTGLDFARAIADSAPRPERGVAAAG